MEQKIRFQRAKTALVNSSDIERQERLGLDNIEVAETKVYAYYPIDASNICVITEHVNNNGEVEEDKCNVIFLPDNLIVAHLSPSEYINVIKGEIVSL